MGMNPMPETPITRESNCGNTWERRRSSHWVSCMRVVNQFLVLLLLSHLLPHLQAQVSQDAINLLALKLDLEDTMGYLSNWRAASDKDAPCSWSGVSCDNESHQISGLDLSSMNLTGRINPSIGLLASLSMLNLSGNSFTGSLPLEITNLTNLDTLDLSENQLTGELPEQISRLKLLTFLSAHDNNFTGPMPVGISELQELEVLDLAGSYFTGTIPPEYMNLTKLKTLKLSGNLLTGEIPREVGNLVALKHLELGYNNYTGGIPREFGMLVPLEYLDLSWTGLSGSIPSEVGYLRQCHTIFLYKNRLTGSLPPEMGNMSGLMSLDISDNMLSGAIPESFGRLNKLTLLHLMMNGLNGSIPEVFGEMDKLETLSLWNNLLTGELPRRLGHFPSLSWIDVSSNLISGEIPRGICSGGSLIKLELFSNAFSGVFPDMSGCQRLFRARFHDNHLSGPIPGAFGSMPNLTRLELSSNWLNGSVPVELSRAPRLAFIDISNNRLQGSIPSSLWSIPQLQELHASGNHLSGELPSLIANASRLSVLDLSENEFQGPIPEELSVCSKLVTLNLRHNSFSGSIPSTLASLPVLAVMDLSWNSLEGRIPPQFAQSRSLEDFNVSHNQLVGQLPSSGLFSSSNPSSFDGNPGLCGGVLPQSCSGSSNSPQSSSESSRRTGQWLMAIFFILSFVILVAGLRFLHKRYGWSCCRGFLLRSLNKSSVRDSVQAASEWPWKMTTYQRVGFTVEELLECIRDKNIIGKGAMGVVYKAEMASGEVVAIKQLCNNRESYYSDQGFQAEVKLLGGIRHRNIVRLLGYCSNHHTDMLLYEYMPNGSLSELLHSRKSYSSAGVLADWVARYNIAMGVAQGLAYLHHDCFPHIIIHRDVKSSNILLDHNMEARVADFGLAKLIQARESMSVVAGSYGYIAPEYAYTMKVREKGDIYSYGIVLLELLTGKRPIEPEFGEGGNIVEWVESKLRKGRLVDVLDWSAGSGCESVQEEMLLVLRISMLCTNRSPRERPSMRDVVSMLAEAKPRRKQVMVDKLIQSSSNATSNAIIGSSGRKGSAVLSIEQQEHASFEHEEESVEVQQ